MENNFTNKIFSSYFSTLKKKAKESEHYDTFNKNIATGIKKVAEESTLFDKLVGGYNKVDSYIDDSAGKIFDNLANSNLFNQVISPDAQVRLQEIFNKYGTPALGAVLGTGALSTLLAARQNKRKGEGAFNRAKRTLWSGLGPALGVAGLLGSTGLASALMQSNPILDRESALQLQNLRQKTGEVFEMLSPKTREIIQENPAVAEGLLERINSVESPEVQAEILAEFENAVNTKGLTEQLVKDTGQFVSDRNPAELAGGGAALGALGGSIFGKGKKIPNYTMDSSRNLRYHIDSLANAFIANNGRIKRKKALDDLLKPLGKGKYIGNKYVPGQSDLDAFDMAFNQKRIGEIEAAFGLRNADDLTNKTLMNPNVSVSVKANAFKSYLDNYLNHSRPVVNTMVRNKVLFNDVVGDRVAGDIITRNANVFDPRRFNSFLNNNARYRRLKLFDPVTGVARKTGDVYDAIINELDETERAAKKMKPEQIGIQEPPKLRQRVAAKARPITKWTGAGGAAGALISLANGLFGGNPPFSTAEERAEKFLRKNK